MNPWLILLIPRHMGVSPNQSRLAFVLSVRVSINWANNRRRLVKCSGEPEFP